MHHFIHEHLPNACNALGHVLDLRETKRNESKPLSSGTHAAGETRLRKLDCMATDGLTPVRVLEKMGGITRKTN